MRFLLPAMVAMLAGLLPASAEPPAAPRFLLACAPCHGFDGIGHDDRTPNLAGQHRDYLHSQLAAFRAGQRKHPQMNFFSGQMTPEELHEIVDYYSALSGR